MLITIVSATPFEISPTFQWLENEFKKNDSEVFEKGDLQIRILITGVGIPLTAFQLGLYLAKEKPDLLINAGVAGAFDRQLKLGQVVHVTSDCFGDLGAEEADGSFINIHQLGLINPDDTPFEKGILNNKNVKSSDFLPQVSGVTINKVHGYPPSIETFRKQYSVDIETMEGAAVFLACLQTDISFLAIRSISNYVEKRNREAWELGLAIENLNTTLIEMLKGFQKQ